MPRYIHPHSLVLGVTGWYRDTVFSFPTIFDEGVIILWHIFIPLIIWWGGDYILTLHFHSWQHLVRGWLHRNIIFSVPTIFGGGDYVVTLYFHSWQYLVRGWLYHVLIFSLLTIFGEGWIISWHCIFTPDNIWWGGDYTLTLYFHSWQYLVRGDYIVTLYFHSWQYLVRGDYIATFSLLTIFGEGVIISWHYISTPDNIWWGGDYIVTLHFHSWQYLVRGVIISWPYISTPDNIWWGGEYIVIFSLLTIFGEGKIISWPYIVTPDNVWWGGIISGHYIFTSDAPLESGTGGDYILMLSLSKFDDAMIPGFIHPMKLGGSIDYI